MKSEKNKQKKRKAVSEEEEEERFTHVEALGDSWET